MALPPMFLIILLLLLNGKLRSWRGDDANGVIDHAFLVLI